MTQTSAEPEKDPPTSDAETAEISDLGVDHGKDPTSADYDSAPAGSPDPGGVPDATEGRAQGGA